MKLTFVGVLTDDSVFINADTGEPDIEDQQSTEPVRLREGPGPLKPARRNALLDRYFDYKNPDSKRAMLSEVGVPDNEIAALLATGGRDGWAVYEKRLRAQREAAWDEEDQGRPHLSLWGYRCRQVKVDGWEGAPRDEVVVRVKHFVLSNEAEVARLECEVERFERFEDNPPTSREPIPEDVQAFVWRRDGGRCVKCGSQERIEFDHIIPLAKGGSNTERNIQLLCEYHNRAKGTADLLFTDTHRNDS